MRCDEIMALLEGLAPRECACDWDNVGLLAGRSDKEVKKVLIALDATDEVVAEAVNLGVDLLLTHHPLIFKPLKQINDQNFISRRILTLLRHDICYYAMHTNFDAAPGCMADAAAEKLDLKELGILDQEGVIYKENRGNTDCPQQEIAYGIGKTGYLKTEMTVREVALMVKERFGLPFLSLYGEHAPGDKVEFIAISPGSGKSMIEPALKAGVQVLITGDIGHHDAIDAAANGLAVIDAGHYGLEYLFMDFMASYMRKETAGKLEIYETEVAFPAVVI